MTDDPGGCHDHGHCDLCDQIEQEAERLRAEVAHQTTVKREAQSVSERLRARIGEMTGTMDDLHRAHEAQGRRVTALEAALFGTGFLYDFKTAGDGLPCWCAPHERWNPHAQRCAALRQVLQGETT